MGFGFHPTDAISDETIYYIYQSRDALGCGGHAVSVRGQLLDNSFSIQRVSSVGGGAAGSQSTTTCADETFCLLAPQSNQCLALTGDVASTAQVSVTFTDQSGIIDSDGQEQLLECDTSNSDNNQQLCIFSPPPCSESSAFPSCVVTLLTGQELVDDPSVLYNPNPPEQVRETAYVVYYSDDICTDVEALHGIVLETSNTVQGVDDTVSCEESVACLLNPTGPSCAALEASLSDTTTGFVVKRDNETGFLYSCSDNDESATCRNITTSACTKSQMFPNCYQRIVWGPDLLSDPESIVTPPIPVDFSLNSTYYLIYFESLDSRNCIGTSVAIEGGMVGDRKTFQTANSGSCAADTACLLDPTSPRCISVIGGQVDTAEIRVTYNEVGSLQLCDTSNVGAGEDLCLLNPQNCDASSIYPSCTYALLTGSELVAGPSILQRENPPEEVEDSIYVLYYTNEDCIKFGALRGLMMDTVNEFPQVEDLELYTCQDTLACFLSPNGEACEDVNTVGMTRSYFTTENGTSPLLSCTEDAGNETCTEVEFETCKPSELYPGCYYSTVRGVDLISNPIRYITPPTNAPSASPSEMPTETPSMLPTDVSEGQVRSVFISSVVIYVAVLLFSFGMELCLL